MESTNQGSSIHVFRVAGRAGRTRGASSASTVGAKSRTSLSAETKRNICEDHEQNPKWTQEELAKKYGCKRTTVAKIIKGKDRWLAIDPHAAVAKRLRQRSSRYPLVENAVMIWLEQAQQQTAVTDQMIQDKAREVAQSFTVMGADEFKASTSWLAKFKQRYLVGTQQPFSVRKLSQRPDLSDEQWAYRSAVQKYQNVFPATQIASQTTQIPSESSSPPFASSPNMDELAYEPEDISESPQDSPGRESMEDVSYRSDIQAPETHRTLTNLNQTVRKTIQALERMVEQDSRSESMDCDLDPHSVLLQMSTSSATLSSETPNPESQPPASGVAIPLVPAKKTVEAPLAPPSSTTTALATPTKTTKTTSPVEHATETQPTVLPISKDGPSVEYQNQSERETVIDRQAIKGVLENLIRLEKDMKEAELQQYIRTMADFFNAEKPNPQESADDRDETVKRRAQQHLELALEYYKTQGLERSMSARLIQLILHQDFQ